MKSHPATKFKGTYPEVIIAPQLPNNIIIGKRTGIPINNDSRTGLDFILQDTVMNKSNCPTKGKKTQSNLFPDSSDESSSSESESESESEDSSLSEDLNGNILIAGNAASSSNNVPLINNEESSSININLNQIAEDLQCPTNYEHEEVDGKKIIFENSVSSMTKSHNQSVSQNCSEINFKSKEEISARSNNMTFKSESIKQANNSLIIEGISTIKKNENSSNGNMSEEGEMMREAFDIKRKAKQSNKTIYEEAEEDLTGNRQSQQVNNDDIRKTIDSNKDAHKGKITVNINETVNEVASDPSFHNNDNVSHNNNETNDSSDIHIHVSNNLAKEQSQVSEHNANKNHKTKFAPLKRKDNENKPVEKKADDNNPVEKKADENKPAKKKTNVKTSQDNKVNDNKHIKKNKLNEKMPMENTANIVSSPTKSLHNKYENFPTEIKPTKKEISEKQYLINVYHLSSTFRNESFEPSNHNNSFGINNRYSLRTRIPRLNPLMGERIKYIRTENGDEVKEVISNRIHLNNYRNQFNIIEPSLIIRKKLSKPLQKLKEDFKQITKDNVIELIINSYSMKEMTRNTKTRLILEIKETNGLNYITINDKGYKNQKKGTRFAIHPLEFYEIRNHSMDELVIALYNEESQ